ncbi:unnamed protein product [Prunus armeniaca]
MLGLRYAMGLGRARDLQDNKCLVVCHSQKHAVNPIDPATPSVVSNANGTPLPPPPPPGGWGGLYISLYFPTFGLCTCSIDVLTGKTIGCSTWWGKLYYLDWPPDSESDVWGLAKIATPAGARWFVTFIDDCTLMTWVSLLKTKGEVCSRFQQFYQMVETQFHARIQVLRSDNGGEFLNHDLN